MLVEDTFDGTHDIALQAGGQIFGRFLLHTDERAVEIFHARGFKDMGGGVLGDAFLAVSKNEGAVKGGVLDGRHLAQHNLEE